MTIYEEQEILIITKTYPTPSKSYRETVCVAGVNTQKRLLRLYPILFRDLEQNRKFKRWQWIKAKISRATGDKRPESYNIDNESIITGQIIDTKDNWSERLSWIDGNIFDSFDKLEEERIKHGTSLGFVKPCEFELIIKEADEKTWTKSQLESLTKQGLFDRLKNSKPVVSKIPYDIYYQYRTSPLGNLHKHKLIDWEAGALFWKCQALYGDKWEEKFREKYEIQFKDKNLLFLLGTQHRFPDQWMLIGIVYPPSGEVQIPLFLQT